MIAEIEENRAKLVEAEAEVPKAMAEAFRSGKLGILDYYKLRNVQADTDMRRVDRRRAGSRQRSAGMTTSESPGLRSLTCDVDDCLAAVDWLTDRRQP